MIGRPTGDRDRTEARVHDEAADDGRKAELRSFLFLTVVMVPVASVLIVAGYGFAVWMFQLFAGPPTG